jgi:lipid II:glycine glycyltransferase (peptidoglycan interpeptide bridge formation enzyme)
MHHPIKESDWKLLRELRPLALNRFCQRVLDEVDRLTAEVGKTSHERYLAVFKLLQKRDKELADAFDDPRRSRAIWQLGHIARHKLLTEEEFARFSSETRELLLFRLGEDETELPGP